MFFFSRILFFFSWLTDRFCHTPVMRNKDNNWNGLMYTREEKRDKNLVDWIFFASTSLPSNTNAPIWSMSIELHGKFLLGRLLRSVEYFDIYFYSKYFALKWFRLQKVTIPWQAIFRTFSTQNALPILTPFLCTNYNNWPILGATSKLHKKIRKIIGFASGESHS